MGNLIHTTDLHKALVVWRSANRKGLDVGALGGRIINMAKDLGWSWHPQACPSVRDILIGGDRTCAAPGQYAWWRK